MTQTNFRNFIYISKNKLEQYVGQSRHATLSKVGSETKLKTPLFDHSVKVEFDSGASKYEKINQIIKDVRERGLMGDLLDYTPWFEARVPVRPLLVGQRVFYVGTLPGSSIMPVNYAFQCSLSNFVGIEDHRAEIDRLNTSGIEKKIRLAGPVITMPSLTSANHMFAEALADISSYVEASESQLLDARDQDSEHFAKFFSSKEDFQLHQKFKPTSSEFECIEKYSAWNNEMLQTMSGWFGGYRDGLIEPPKLSFAQSRKNLLGLKEIKRALGSDIFARKMEALKKLHNFRMVTKKIKSDPESRILNGILEVSHGKAEGTIEIVGIRLLDGYYRKEGYSSEGRVILGSPLFLAT